MTDKKKDSLWDTLTGVATKDPTMYEQIRDRMNSSLTGMNESHMMDANRYAEEMRRDYERNLMMQNMGMGSPPRTTAAEVRHRAQVTNHAVSAEALRTVKGHFYTQLFELWADMIPMKMRVSVIENINFSMHQSGSTYHIRMAYNHKDIENPAVLTADVDTSLVSETEFPDFREDINIFLVKLVMLNG